MEQKKSSRVQGLLEKYFGNQVPTISRLTDIEKEYIRTIVKREVGEKQSDACFEILNNLRNYYPKIDVLTVVEILEKHNWDTKRVYNEVWATYFTSRK